MSWLFTTQVPLVCLSSIYCWFTSSTKISPGNILRITDNKVGAMGDVDHPVTLESKYLGKSGFT